MNTPNCCTDLKKVVDWFEKLKADGIPRNEILDALDFDSDQYPDMNILREARRIVYGEI